MKKEEEKTFDNKINEISLFSTQRSSTAAARNTVAFLRPKFFFCFASLTLPGPRICPADRA
jgi:hypothetical protein